MSPAMRVVSEGRRPRYKWRQSGEVNLVLCFDHRTYQKQSHVYAFSQNMAWGPIYTQILYTHFPKGFCHWQSQDTVLDGLGLSQYDSAVVMF